MQSAKIGKFCLIFANLKMNSMKKAVLTVVAVLLVLLLQAQDIKILPIDPAIKMEVMPNGLKCYVAVNTSLKGIADFALIQNTGGKTISSIDRERIVDIAQDGLASQKRLLCPTVQEFFTSLGAVPGKEGFVKVTDDATVYHFHNVNIAARKEALDSTLLVMMGIVDRVTDTEDLVLRKWYTPSDQAIVVAGDVDAAKVLKDLRYLSYMTMASPSSQRRQYEWKDSASALVRTVADTSSVLSSFHLSWRLPLTPRDRMNTVQPIVFEKYMSALALIADARIRNSLQVAGLHYADVTCRYDIPENHLDDEKFKVSVTVAEDKFEEAVSVVSRVMAELDAGKVDARELERAEYAYFDQQILKERTHFLSNSLYISRCQDAFLYNASLSSEKEKRSFLMSRSIPDTTELKIFKTIVAAALDPMNNVSVCGVGTGAGMDEKALFSLFGKSWMASDSLARPSEIRVPSMCDPAEKIKVRSIKKEYLSGGTLWTLSNGFRVVVKQTAEKNVVHWSLVLNGGYGNIEDLREGEAPYLSEYLDMCRIGGIDATSFRDAARRRGMTMDFKVNHSNTCLKGRIPYDELEYLLRSLTTILNTSKPDYRQAEYVMGCAGLRKDMRTGTLEERIAVIDSIMCPGYRYSIRRLGFDRDFIGKAEKFFDNLSRRVNTGVLVLVGDVDEKRLKEVLMTFGGAFVTSSKTLSRPVVSYQPISGTVTHKEAADENSVYMVMSTPISLTVGNYYASEIAGMCLRRSLSRIVTGRGLSVSLKHKCSLYPQERLSMMISLNEASVEGFAPGTSHSEPLEALASVRLQLKDLGSIDLTDTELASYKALLKQRVKRRQSDPEFWLEAVPLRYLEGKDFTSGYQTKIDAVTREDVIGLLQLLSEGARVEYIIEKR